MFWLAAFMEVDVMPSDPNDVRTVWQNQTKEPSNVSLELIRYKARKLEGTIRQQVMAIYVVVLLIVAACVFLSWRIDEILMRIGAGILVLWALSLAYRTRKRVWPGRLAPDATLRVSLDSYRQELERQRFYLRAGVQTVLPVLLSTALFFTPAVMQKPELLVKMLPFLTIMMAWAVALIVMTWRKLRAIQIEVDEIDVLQEGR
jgi:hypothetical protein